MKHAILNRQGREARMGSVAVPGHVALFALILMALPFGAGAQAPPGVSRVYPSTGPETGGVHVRIIGSGFTGATRVTFGGADALEFHVRSDSVVDAILPPLGNGQVSIPPGGYEVDAAVCTAAGCSPQYIPGNFRYL
jgi:hypothetical protein